MNFRFRRSRWLFFWGALIAGVLGLMINRSWPVSPAEKKVHAYFEETRGKPWTEWAYNREALGRDAIPFLVPAAAKQNSSVREALLRVEKKVAPFLPSSLTQKMLLSTDATSDRVAAVADMDLFVAVHRDPTPFEPFLKHSDRQVRMTVIELLGIWGRDRKMDSLPILTNALSSERDEFVRFWLAKSILAIDTGNAPAIAIVGAAQTSSNTEAAAAFSTWKNTLGPFGDNH